MAASRPVAEVHPQPVQSRNLSDSNDASFRALIDIHQFKPEEVTVKIVDSQLIVEGQHEEKEDGHGLISRKFVRKYNLPKDSDVNAIKSCWSKDGILKVTAPPIKRESKERMVKIELTGKPSKTPSQADKSPAKIPVKSSAVEDPKKIRNTGAKSQKDKK